MSVEQPTPDNEFTNPTEPEVDVSEEAAAARDHQWGLVGTIKRLGMQSREGGKATAELWSVVHPGVVRFARFHCANRYPLLDAQDIASEAMMRGLKGIAGLERRSQKSQGIGWFIWTAQNIIIDWGRKSGRSRYEEATDGPLFERAVQANPMRYSVDVENIAVQGLVRDEVLQAIASLPRSHREYLILFYFYGLSQEEIARQTNRALGNVQALSFKARRRLTEVIRREYPGLQPRDLDEN